VTALVGREEAIADAAFALHQDDVRLLTITGPGGVGKTRVAQAVAAAVAEEFADGVVFVPLQTVRDPDLVSGTIARAVGLFDVEGDLEERLVAQLAARTLLLVVDNFEQVVDAAPSLARIVASCPNLRMVVTSRTPLHVATEQELPLAPLADDAAVTLFVDRASAVRPEFARDVDRRVVSELCHRLDRLPLAIELAAARVRLLTPEAMLARIEHRLELLTSGPRDAPLRHQALGDTIGWSFELLDDDARELFVRLAVFTGGCTLEDAEQVCGASLNTLGSLVDHSLLRAGEDRFAMLETIREYAAGLLATTPEETALRRRHAAHYAALAETAAPLLTGPEQASWRTRLEADHDNLRAAMRFSLLDGDAETALRLCGSLWRFWLERGYLGEGRAWLDEALSAPSAGSLLRARVLTGDGVLSHYQGDYARADVLCGEALELARSLDDEKGVAEALTGLALVRRTLGDYREAEELFREALAVYEALGDETGIARTLDRLAIALAVAGENTRAHALFERSLELSRRLGDATGVALALHGLAFTRPTGRDAEAKAQAAESLSILRDLGDRRNVAKVIWTVGDVGADLGDADAAACLEEALTLCVDFGDPWFCGVALEEASHLALATGDAERAARLLGAADAVRAGIGAPLPGMFLDEHARVESGARASLGDERFDVARGEGRGMPLHATIELVNPTRPRPSLEVSEGLTPRELEVLALVAQGLTDAEVAERLVVSLRTVHAHLRSTYRKLDVHSRSAATRYALEHGLAA